MKGPHHSILDAALEVPRTAFEWLYISDYYDGPIAGLAVFQDRIVRFCAFQEDIPRHDILVFQELDPDELEAELKEKERFERMVGTHWSFDGKGNALPDVRAPEELMRQFYEEAQPHPVPKPTDRPIIAWVDLSV